MRRNPDPFHTTTRSIIMTNKQHQACLDELKSILSPRRGETLPSAARRLIGDITTLSRHNAELTAAASGAIVRIPVLTIPPDSPPPPVEPDLGDLTPAFARWIIQTQPLESCRERYADRERYLPDDVQAALKGQS